MAKGTLCRRQLTEPLPPRLPKATSKKARVSFQLAKRGNVYSSILHANVGTTIDAISPPATGGKDGYWFAAVILVRYWSYTSEPGLILFHDRISYRNPLRSCNRYRTRIAPRVCLCSFDIEIKICPLEPAMHQKANMLIQEWVEHIGQF